jgi:hypothetical protein
MSEHDPDPVGVETPEADAKEQHTPVRDYEQQEWRIQMPFDADEADATDQERLVELDEDDYR